MEPKLIQTPMTLLDFSIHGWLKGSHWMAENPYVCENPMGGNGILFAIVGSIVGSNIIFVFELA